MEDSDTGILYWYKLGFSIGPFLFFLLLAGLDFIQPTTFITSAGASISYYIFLSSLNNSLRSHETSITRFHQLPYYALTVISVLLWAILSFMSIYILINPVLNFREVTIIILAIILEIIIIIPIIKQDKKNFDIDVQEEIRNKMKKFQQSQDDKMRTNRGKYKL